eukprot:6720861-Alexandrium_andersonii.AAC.1
MQEQEVRGPVGLMLTAAMRVGLKVDSNLRVGGRAGECFGILDVPYQRLRATALHAAFTSQDEDFVRGQWGVEGDTSVERDMVSSVLRKLDQREQLMAKRIMSR